MSLCGSAQSSPVPGRASAGRVTIGVDDFRRIEVRITVGALSACKPKLVNPPVRVLGASRGIRRRLDSATRSVPVCGMVHERRGSALDRLTTAALCRSPPRSSNAVSRIMYPAREGRTRGAGARRGLVGQGNAGI